MDLHIHSHYSPDSFTRPKDIIKIATKKKLELIAVTDHNSIKGGLVTYNENKRLNSDLFVIIGEEIHTNVGDIIGIFINEEIKSKNVNEVLDEIADQDGLVVLPHPMKHHNLQLLNPYLDKIEFVEVLNSRSPISIKKMNILHSYNKKELGSSDAHFAFEIGKCFTFLDASFKPNSYDELPSIIKKYPLYAEGNFSPPFVEKCSQMIKTIKNFTHLES